MYNLQEQYRDTSLISCLVWWNNKGSVPVFPYELAGNWKNYESKQQQYEKAFEADHILVGRLHKYGDVAQAARDIVHWCKIVASEERELAKNRADTKSELAEKHRHFLAACNKYLDSLV